MNNKFKIALDRIQKNWYPALLFSISTILGITGVNNFSNSIFDYTDQTSSTSIILLKFSVATFVLAFSSIALNELIKLNDFKKGLSMILHSIQTGFLFLFTTFFIDASGYQFPTADILRATLIFTVLYYSPLFVPFIIQKSTAAYKHYWVGYLKAQVLSSVFAFIFTLAMLLLVSLNTLLFSANFSFELYLSVATFGAIFVYGMLIISFKREVDTTIQTYEFSRTVKIFRDFIITPVSVIYLISTLMYFIQIFSFRNRVLYLDYSEVMLLLVQFVLGVYVNVLFFSNDNKPNEPSEKKKGISVIRIFNLLNIPLVLVYFLGLEQIDSTLGLFFSVILGIAFTLGILYLSISNKPRIDFIYLIPAITVIATVSLPFLNIFFIAQQISYNQTKQMLIETEFIPESYGVVIPFESTRQVSYGQFSKEEKAVDSYIDLVENYGIESTKNLFSEGDYYRLVRVLETEQSTNKLKNEFGRITNVDFGYYASNENREESPTRSTDQTKYKGISEINFELNSIINNNSTIDTNNAIAILFTKNALFSPKTTTDNLYVDFSSRGDSITVEIIDNKDQPGETPVEQVIFTDIFTELEQRATSRTISNNQSNLRNVEELQLKSESESYKVSIYLTEITAGIENDKISSIKEFSGLVIIESKV